MNTPTASAPLVSVVICTHNRSTDVARCLGALWPQRQGRDVPCVVVDSASDPDAKAALETIVAQYPGLELMRLDEPGLSKARNAGVAATASVWIAFLDDDAVPAPDWLEKLTAVLQSAPADCGAIGGRIVPIFPEGMCPKLGARWRMYLSLNEQEGDRDCTERFELIAANCTFRRAALEEAGGMPLGLGRVGTHLLSGEDTLLMFELRRLGWRIRYNSSFSVGHVIPAARLDVQWVRQRAYWEGITTVKLRRMLRLPGLGRLIAKAALAVPMLAVASVAGQTLHEFDLRLWHDLGILAEGLMHRSKSES